MPRAIHQRYADPLEEVWLQAARRVGWTVVRAPSAYASWDGEGTLTLAPPGELDPDDTLAQMILHEMCHALVAGPSGASALDWGLDNTTDRDVVKEHATNRLQAALAEPYGLREFMAVTTDFRSYYDALPRKPLADGDDPATALAVRARQRAEREPFASALSDALEATARLAELVRPVALVGSLWRTVRPRHRSGMLMPRERSPVESTCAECVWAASEGDSLFCRQASSTDAQEAGVGAADLACERFEPRFGADECGRCGACCREGFDLVPVDELDSVVRLHPTLVGGSSLGPALLRPAGRCVALLGGGSAAYRCGIYADRPKSCREFEVAGEACLVARQRVGLSAS